MNEPKVSIILVNWNQKKDIVECISSIKKSSYSNYDIIVVDNNSTDSSVSLIKKRFPEVKLIETAKNLGFAGANNIGIDHALRIESKYVLLLNSDTITHKKLLTEIVNVMEKTPYAGVLGPMIYFYDSPQEIWFGGGEIDSNTGRFRHIDEGKENREVVANKIRECDFITGCAMLISSEVLRNIGLLDSAYFMYYEDSDFCVRAHKAGYKIIFVPSAEVWHKKKKGPLPSYYYFYNARNRLLFVKKFSSYKGKWFQSYLALKMSVAFLVKHKNPHASILSIKGAINFFKLYR